MVARARPSRYRGGVSLRRLRYQLQCAHSGHDVRPYMVDGSHVAQRCLRCGATVGEAELEGAAAEPGADIVPARRIEPQPSQLPPAPIERRPEADGDVPAEADGDAPAEADDAPEPGDDSTHAALAALRELGELHAAGVLTDREFARKKAELLRRV
jgi:Short C-terminal domain